MDWKSELADSVRDDVLSELGGEITVEVPDVSTRSTSGKKVPSSFKSYPGVAVMGGYATQAEEQGAPLIKAGDTKFVVQFRDGTFEPDGKLDEKILFGGARYTLADAKRVNPDGKYDIVWIVYARRVN